MLVAMQVLSVILLLQGGIAHACIGGPSDQAAIEVVLNKPSITYDLSKIKDFDGIVRIDEETYVYRSHLSADIKIILTLQKVSTQSNAPKYLTIRVQSPTKILNFTYTEYTARLVLEEVKIDPETFHRVVKSEGWDIEEFESSEDSFGALLTKNISNSSIVFMLKAREAKNGYDLYITITVKGGTNPEVEEAIESLITAVAGTEQEIRFEEISHTEHAIEPEVGADILKAALAYELKWLLDAGIIEGLSEDDIAEIVEASELGCSGWNSRMVYANGDWMPYYDALAYIPGAALVRGGCADIEAMLESVSIPNTAPESHGTDTSIGETSVDNTIPLLVSLAIGASLALITWIAIKRAH